MASGRSVKTDGLFLGIVILAVAASVILWQAFDYSPWIMPFAVVLGVGAYLVAASFAMPKASRVGPSESSYYAVNGVIAITVGAIGIVKIVADVNIWYLVGAFLAVVAALIIWRSASPRD